ncbi:lipoprotein-releasing system transmembrane subunit LolC [Shewanella sp. OPT22]|nr:lipoprotein-releasing system transmembrane subunit LolC [Shewanella sp. OPT22]
MNLNVSLLIGFRYWKAKKANSFSSFITFFAVSGIFLGVAALIIVTSVMNGLEGQLKGKLLGAVSQLTVQSEQPLADWQQRVKQISEIKGVIGVTPSVSTQAMVQSNNGIAAMELYGINPKDGHLVSSIDGHIYPGSFDDLKPSKYQVILGNELARRLGVKVGQEIRIYSGDGVIYSPIGPVPSQRKFTVVGVFETGSQVDATIAYTHYKDARRLVRKSPSQVSDLRVFLEDAFEFSSVESQIKSLFAEQKVELKDWRKIYGTFFGAVQMENKMMSLMLSLIVLVAAFNIVSALVMMVVDKTADVAMLKTQGMTTQSIMGIFVFQGLLNTIIGMIGGMIVGVAITLNLNPILKILGVSILGPGMSLPVELEWQRILYIAIGTVVVSLLATIYPALKASKVEPAHALRYE